MDGKWVVYWKNGIVLWEGNYVDGNREGKSVWYYESGKIKDVDIYKDGKCVEMCEGDEKN